MVFIQSQDFDLQKIADSGQCFRLNETGTGRYILAAGNRVLFLQSRTGGVEMDCSPSEYEAHWRAYFDLDTDYRSIRESVPKNDAYLHRAVAFGRGIRILHQDSWEVLISFLISQRKNIPAIRRAVELLCSRYGEEIIPGIHAFPTAERLAQLSREELLSCSLGYRADYVLSAAKITASGRLQSLAQAEDAALLDTLQTLPGVGPKVANCVALFGYHRLSGFPRDVWINRVIQEQYGGQFFPEQYAGFAGVIQQYLFYYVRHCAREHVQ